MVIGKKVELSLLGYWVFLVGYWIFYFLLRVLSGKPMKETRYQNNQKYKIGIIHK
jgi:hypothetical protein